MLNSMPRNRQLHAFLEEQVVALKPHAETTRNESDQFVKTDTDIKIESIEPVTTEIDIRNRSVEPITIDTDIRIESKGDYEYSDYVVVDSRDSGSGFEESENYMTDEKGLHMMWM
ncbi:hypothetical protein V6N13_076222 [Hibiscus sabdariffa]